MKIINTQEPLNSGFLHQSHTLDPTQGLLELEAPSLSIIR